MVKVKRICWSNEILRILKTKLEPLGDTIQMLSNWKKEQIDQVNGLALALTHRPAFTCVCEVFKKDFDRVFRNSKTLKDLLVWSKLTVQSSI